MSILDHLLAGTYLVSDRNVTKTEWKDQNVVASWSKSRSSCVRDSLRRRMPGRSCPASQAMLCLQGQDYILQVLVCARSSPFHTKLQEQSRCDETENWEEALQDTRAASLFL